MEVMQGIEGETRRNQSEGEAQRNHSGPSNSQPSDPERSTQTARPKPPPGKGTQRQSQQTPEQDLEAELEALKMQIDRAVHQARKGREESVEEELARIKASTKKKSP